MNRKEKEELVEEFVTDQLRTGFKIGILILRVFYVIMFGISYFNEDYPAMAFWAVLLLALRD